MTTRELTKLLRIVALALLLGQQGVFALLSMDGTRNQVYVYGGVTFSYDSNLFSDSSGRSDSSVTGRAGLEYQRRAGLIAVDANAYVDILRFQDFTDQDAVNPHFSVNLQKTTGRMTGSLRLSAYRESRSDTAVNLRTESWNYPASLSLKYPVNERYYVTSDTGYNQHKYADNAALVDYRDWSEDVNLYYIYTSKLDLSGGYRIRVSETDLGRAVDHNFSVGATGGLLPKLSGTVRVGYQVRKDDVASQSYNVATMMAQLTWMATRKLSVDSQISRDFNTSAIGDTVDTFSASLTGTYSFTRRLRGVLGVSVGRNDFVSEAPPQREDTYVTWNAGANYTINEHFTLNATYTYFKNSSTVPTADYDRDVVVFDVSGRF